MMVRFSCFSSPAHHKSKKVVEHLTTSTETNSGEGSQDQAMKVSHESAGSTRKVDDNNIIDTRMDQITSTSAFEECWKSEDFNGSPGDSKELLQVVHLKKSQSLGNVLERGQGFSCSHSIEDDEEDQPFRLGNMHEDDQKIDVDSCDKASSAELDHHEDREMTFPQHLENDMVNSLSFQTNFNNQGSLFSIGDMKQFDGDLDDGFSKHCTYHVADSGTLSPHNPPIFPTSRSLVNLKVDVANSNGDVLPLQSMEPRSRSFDNLSLFRGKSGKFLDAHATLCPGGIFYGQANSDRRSSPPHEDSNTSCGYGVENQEGDDYSWRKEVKNKDASAEGFDALNCNGLEADWKAPEENVDMKERLQQGSSIHFFCEPASKDFKINRIEEWINQINIQDSCTIQEIGESSSSAFQGDSNMVAGMATKKVDGRSCPDMQVAYNFMSSLTPTSTSAQMANLGLVAVPILSAFVNLRVLNLSGNGIVRVKAGALPRSLHMLNLSKNSIATIEGLRELSRLRVLDLSYNRISRIGPGLASCNSLKELYLAGNKISEVEGVHRLLKLHILDLRFNKISTTKGLGQLAANTSLQAINLEGNPAQRNVGDEQLKKYLVSLLPKIVYFNKQTIRGSSSKDLVDRSARSIPVLPYDRSVRSEHKHSRKGAHGPVQKSVASSSQGRSSHHSGPSQKLSKSRHGRPPPPGLKGTHHLPIIGTSMLSLQPANPIRRTQSEGNL